MKRKFVLGFAVLLMAIAGSFIFSTQSNAKESATKFRQKVNDCVWDVSVNARRCIAEGSECATLTSGVSSECNAYSTPIAGNNGECVSSQSGLQCLFNAQVECGNYTNAISQQAVIACIP